MAKICVLGAGLNGLTTAMLLARDGHSVTVLERDPAEPIGDADAAWQGWERRGVSQFRLPHFMLARWTAELNAELPAVLDELLARGGLRFDVLDALPESISGARRDGDERLGTVTARRPVIEAAVAAAAANSPRVDVRRGVAVHGLVTGPQARGDVPHVVGVTTVHGETVAADLVVDAGGRRSALPAWLAAVGASDPYEEREDAGFVYYGRHFRAPSGELPALYAGLLQDYASLSVLTLPADNGTWSVALIVSARDPALRSLRDVEVWSRVLAGYPLAAHWVDGEPLHDGVVPFAGLEDRYRRFVIDGRPVATGVVAVGDAWACTNPSLGRGASIGLLHGIALRDLLRDADPTDADKLVRRFDEVTAETIEPLYRLTLAYDRHRLAEIDHDIAGDRYRPDDPSWAITKAMKALLPSDPDVLRAYLDVVMLRATPAEALAAHGVLDRVRAAAAGNHPQYTLPGPDRAGLLAAVRS